MDYGLACARLRLLLLLSSSSFYLCFEEPGLARVEFLFQVEEIAVEATSLVDAAQSVRRYSQRHRLVQSLRVETRLLHVGLNTIEFVFQDCVISDDVTEQKVWVLHPILTDRHFPIEKLVSILFAKPQ